MNEEIEKEVARLRRRYSPLAHESPEAREVAARWVVAASGLRWFVPLEDVVEADIDVEIARDVVIVRARRTSPERVVLVGILPVPREFDPEQPEIRFSEETLEIRVRWVRRETAR